MIDRFSKNIQGVVYQFLDSSDLLRLERVSTKTSLGSRQDYLWRYLAERTLPFCQKYLNLTWKETFWRNVKASNRMSNKMTNLSDYNFEMCPIRHFKSLIKFLDVYNNFIFAADDQGNLAVFLIAEDDLENDNDSMKVVETQTIGIEFLKFYPDTGSLVFVTSDAKVNIWRIEQTGINKFEITDKKVVGIDIKVDTLYVSQMTKNHIVICNYPLESDPFHTDTTITVFDIEKQEVQFQQVIEVEVSEEKLAQGLGIGMGGMHPMFRQPMGQMQTTQEQLKADRQQLQLGTFNGDRLVISLYNAQLLVIDTTMSKVDLFLKKRNWNMIDPLPEGTPVALNMYHFQGILVTYNRTSLNVFDYQLMTLKQTIPFNPVQRSIFNFDHLKSELAVFVNEGNASGLITYEVDLKNKSMKQSQKQGYQHSDKVVTDIDMNRFVIANATSKAEVQLYNKDNLQEKPIYVNCGSKTVKSYIEHPRRPGVSMVKVAQSKVVAVQGNIMRVYSFDVK